MSDPVAPYIEAIKGVPADDPKNPPIRMEIRDMIENEPKMWELYVLGLQRFQDVDKDKTAGGKEQPLSWFQVAGVHGIPYQKWPNESWNDNMEPYKGQSTRGFCTHSSILFLPWHRPYLALFEHELHKHIQEVAKEPPYNGDQGYADAAKKFRMPYWDWALSKRTLFPDEVLQRTPGSKLFPGSKLEHNPLSSYVLPDDVASNYKRAKYPRTVRYATRDYVEGGDNKQDEDTQRTRIIDALTQPRADLLGNNVTERTAYILKSYTSFRAMSNNEMAEKNGDVFENYGSLEDVHNTIHGATGGGGQMSSIAVSAFDPVFWLHHTNIDRLWAIWQAIHPDSYVVKTLNEGNGTWSHGSNDEDENTTLTPWFKGSKSDFYNSRDCITTTPFGYTYPELVGNPTKDELLERVDKLYPDGSTQTMISHKDSFASAAASKIVERAKVHRAIASRVSAGQAPQIITTAESVPIQEVVLPQERNIEDIVVENRYLEWLVDIRARKHALSGHYTVHIFLGEPDDSNPLGWLLSPEHVSFFAPLGQESTTACDKCQVDQANALVITSQIPLTIALLERYMAGLLESLQPRHVEPYLKKNLHWRALDYFGNRVEPSDVQDLVVAVVSNGVRMPIGDETQPRYDDFVQTYPDITTRLDGTGRGAGTGYTASTA